MQISAKEAYDKIRAGDKEFTSYLVSLSDSEAKELAGRWNLSSVVSRNPWGIVWLLSPYKKDAISIARVFGGIGYIEECAIAEREREIYRAGKNNDATSIKLGGNYYYLDLQDDEFLATVRAIILGGLKQSPWLCGTALNRIRAVMNSYVGLWPWGEGVSRGRRVVYPLKEAPGAKWQIVCSGSRARVMVSLKVGDKSVEDYYVLRGAVRTMSHVKDVFGWDIAREKAMKTHSKEELNYIFKQNEALMSILEGVS